MKNIFCLIFIIFFLITCNKDKLDLKKNISSEELNIYINKGKYYFYRPYIKNNYENSLAFFDKVNKLRQKDQTLINYWNELNYSYQFLEKYDQLYKILLKRNDINNLYHILLYLGKYEDALKLTLKNINKSNHKDLYYGDLIFLYYKLGNFEDAKKYYLKSGNNNIWFIPIFISEKNYIKVDEIIENIESESVDLRKLDYELLKNSGFFNYLISEYYFKERKMFEKALNKIEIGINTEIKRINLDINYVDFLKRKKIGYNDERMNPLTGYAVQHPEFNIRHGGLEYRDNPNMYISISKMYNLKSDILKALRRDKDSEKALEEVKYWEGKRSYRDFFEFVDESYMKDDPEYQKLFIK